MNDERIRQMNDGNDDNSREDSIRSMLREFYSRKMASVAAFVWTIGLLFLAAAVYSTVAFFRTAETKDQIMYASIFITCFNGVGLMKVFAWQMVHRNSVKREIKRLEVQIAELMASTNKAAR